MNPTEAAKRAMLELTNRKLPPTPANYARIYGAITGDSGAMTAAEAIELLSARMPDRAGTAALREAIRGNDWRSVGAILEEALHDADERVRAVAASTPAVPAAGTAEGLDSSCDPTTVWAPPVDMRVTRRLASALLRLMEDIEPPVSGMAPLRARERLLYTLAKCEEPGELTAAIEELARAWQRTTSDSRAAAGSGGGPAAQPASLLVDPGASPAAVIQGIGEILMLLVGEIEEVVPEGYLDADELKRLRSLLGGTIDLGRLKDVKGATRSIIIKSGIARYGLSEAKRAVADMLDSLLRRATECEGAGRDYERKLRAHGHAIARSSNLVMFTYGLHDLLAQISIFTTDMLRARGDLAAGRQHDDESHDRVQTLERDTDLLRMQAPGEAAASVLGRCALEHAYTEELARKADAPGETCLAIVAIDEITRARDHRGDAGADEALMQLLIQMVRRATRTRDVVGRYNEGWIAIMMPGTSVEGAKSVMLRLQRSLTTSLFLRYRERNRAMVTFGCGVTRLLPGMCFEDAIAHASAGLERAQSEGRNKVVAV